ncbi:cache domain-containing protein [Candidatus Symbiobacter mobilis]|uniref:histidine kinase n=1 Tax=Candidatus Symbiobacter mobilis CR TaxID=946483 RepID=U5NCY6_9BURK|nr:cache domain-containing protein [Candidatus Symbiobacter mobilis]AGX88103.1 signal transduction histidine kinase [Candidatus Symbiobacter mobilis CR]
MPSAFQSRLFRRIYILITVGLAVLFGVLYALSVPFTQRTVADLEERSAHTILDNVYELVEKIHTDQQVARAALIEERKEALRHIVEVVHSRAQMLDAKVHQGAMTRAAARQALLEELRHIRYGHGGYIFAADYQGTTRAHIDPALIDQDFSTQRDAHGNLILQPMIDGARRAGEGFHIYWWRRLGEPTPSEKLSYYKNLESFGLVIGSGMYLDDIDAAMRTRLAVATDNLRRRLRTIHIAQSGYVYIFTGKMQMIIHPNANIEETDVSGLIDQATGKPLMPMLQAAADTTSGLRYQWNCPFTLGEGVCDKISWVRHHVGYDWYIGASVYLADLNASGIALRNRMLTVFGTTWLVAMALVYLFTRTLTTPLQRLSATAHRIQQGDLNARCPLLGNDEIGIVAQAFNAMVAQLQDNIRHLDEKVSQRTSELAHANEELQQLDRLKTDFLSTISHELRTPTTSIVGFSKLIRKKLDAAVFPIVPDDASAQRAIVQIRQNLDIVAGEGERLTRLITDVLDSAQLQAGRVDWRFATLPVQRILDRLRDATSTLFAKSPYTLVFDIHPPIPDIRADDNRILQVLVNLVDNAVKFGHDGDIVVGVQALPAAVCFRVEDHGPGIAPEAQQRLFQSFQQLGDTLTEKPQGTGLGLSICRRIVEHHGGKIWLESTLGQGSVFFFTVPLAHGDS